MTKEEQASKLINDLGIDRIISEFIVDYDDTELRDELIYQILDRFRWRDVNIEPPTKEGEYIVFNGQIGIAEWFGDGWGLYDVTHWMPKIEPPTK